MEAITVDELSRFGILKSNKELAEKMKGDVVLIRSDILPPLDDEFRVAIENIMEDKKGKKNLIVILETRGGYMETVERLVSIMRKHYDHVSFVVPNFAYSAGTVLVLSGDKIYMDYYSVLGPIDPQVPSEDGYRLSGYGALEKFKELKKTVNSANSADEVRAELAILIKKFDPASIFQIEQAIEHGITLITEWLPKYKFRDWKKTKSKKDKVTSKMRKDRAQKIARALGDASKWHSHGRGISMQRLQGDEIKLEIDDFGQDKKLNSTIKNYCRLAQDHFERLGMKDYIHTSKEVRRVR